MIQKKQEMTNDGRSAAQKLRAFPDASFFERRERLEGGAPGETIEINEEIIRKANILFAELAKELPALLEKKPHQRVVLTVCGGSGVGKTSIAALLADYFRQAGLGCCMLAGDNYPHRIPKQNDAERLRIFRESGIHRMIKDGVYTKERFLLVQKWQQMEDDANPVHLQEADWFASYLEGGKRGLQGYLGTEQELAFGEMGAVTAAFHDGAKKIWLRKMGREETQLWYDCVDFRTVSVLLIEWTHGNSDFYEGVDFPILLNSTPQETLAYRKSRNRDGAVDSAFTTMVLNIEQELLHRQASKAKLILSKAGELLTYEAYCRLMEEG